MKKLYQYLFALVAFGTLVSSCSNDFDLTSPWKEIPVVYAILSPKDEYHYIRVEKAFLDPEKSALVVAQIADSLYYREEDISVFLQKKGETALYPLERVDGNLYGHVRDTGIFANTPNWLYRIKNSNLPGGLKEQSTYLMVIKRKDGRPDITAETTIPKSFQIVAPNTSGTPRVIQFTGDTPTSFRWTHDANAVYFNVTVTLPYRERDANGTLIRRDTIVWRAASNELATPGGSGNTQLLINGAAFFQVLVDNIKTPNDGRVRVFGTTISIKVEGGGKEIRDFVLTEEANSGLTGAEIVQTYTNLSEGIGIFTAKNVALEGDFRLGDQTITALLNSPLTRDLNIKIQ